MNKISTGSYKTEDAIIIENETLKTTILPGWGSKLVSLIYKPLEYELFWQNPGARYRKTTYGDPYERGEASGFDEMFPTISRCFYETEPWAGIQMPDHGEVWSVPWAYEIDGDTLLFRVRGVRFPFLLEKRVHLEQESIVLEYRAENKFSMDMDCIWAAHPLFNTVPGMELAVPEGMTKIVNTVQSRRIGPYGWMYDFPKAELLNGTIFDLSKVPKKNSSDYQKYWFVGRVPEGWCTLYNPEQELNIGLIWPEDTVPYLGMWVNEGGWEEQYNIAPEPATGAMDRVDSARMWGMNNVLPAGRTQEWWLLLTLRRGKRGVKGPLRG